MDKPLSLDAVNQLATLIYELPPDQARQLALRMKREQPALHRYLSALPRPPFSEDEFGYVVTLGMTLWAVLGQAGRPAGEVTREGLQRASDAWQAQVAGLLAAQPEHRQTNAMLSITGYPEPGLLGYLVAALAQKNDPPLRDEPRALAFFHLRVVLDALLASRKPPRRPARRRSSRRPTGRA